MGENWEEKYTKAVQDINQRELERIALLKKIASLKEEIEELKGEEELEEVEVEIIRDLRANEIISKGKGTLMFPTEYRKLDSCDIENWKDIRKKYDLTGRGWEVYIKTNPNKTSQNKEVKYKTPHFCDKGWEGAYEDKYGYTVTDYVYGDVYIVKRPAKEGL